MKRSGRATQDFPDGGGKSVAVRQLTDGVSILVYRKVGGQLRYFPISAPNQRPAGIHAIYENRDEFRRWHREKVPSKRVPFPEKFVSVYET